MKITSLFSQGAVNFTLPLWLTQSREEHRMLAKHDLQN
jgi:hypothetical protein